LDQIESERAAARELIALAHDRGFDLASFCQDAVFVNGNRWIFLWREGGQFGYHMQGRIEQLPACLPGSETAFRGMWNEVGYLPDLNRAFEFMIAWLPAGRQVDDLPVPERTIKRRGI